MTEAQINYTNYQGFAFGTVCEHYDIISTDCKKLGKKCTYRGFRQETEEIVHGDMPEYGRRMNFLDCPDHIEKGA